MLICGVLEQNVAMMTALTLLNKIERNKSDFFI